MCGARGVVCGQFGERRETSGGAGDGREICNAFVTVVGGDGMTGKRTAVSDGSLRTQMLGGRGRWWSIRSRSGDGGAFGERVVDGF